MSYLEDKRCELRRAIDQKSRPPARETGATSITLHENLEESHVPREKELSVEDNSKTLSGGPRGRGASTHMEEEAKLTSSQQLPVRYVRIPKRNRTKMSLGSK